MLKRLCCALMTLILLPLLSGCRTPLENTTLPAATLPPADPIYAAPTDDAALNYTRTVPLYLPSRDGQRLLARYVPVSMNHGRQDAESVARALLAFPGDESAGTLGNGTALGLYGSSPVEVSGGVCTVNLASSALQLSSESFYNACLALSSTLCSLEDIHYVNVLITDRAVSMDITGNLPLGSLTAHPGEELPLLWEQLEARRTPLGEDPATMPLTSVATLYFPLADGSGVIAETRSLSFAGQTADQQAAGLCAALSSGAQYLSGVSAMPDLGRLMSSPPRAAKLDDGGRLVNLYFYADLEKTLRQAGVDMPCFVAAVTSTLTSFIPAVSSVRFYMGETPITSAYSRHHGSSVFPSGLVQRQQFAPYLMEQTTLYFTDGDHLKAVQRAVPYRESLNPRHLLALLMAGPTQDELDGGLFPVLPIGLTEEDILGVALMDGTLILNLSGRCAELLRAQADISEQLACYSMVNTLCRALGIKRVRFFFDGEMAETLAGMLYWGGEFLLNPGLIDQTLG